MANINILDKSIFNRIAAGEVVEKPASVVKELIENSIDAGATNITIEIENGGIKKIRVTDNGCGMDIENLPKSFLPHATSKISCLDDLDKIGTLGFRGEAVSLFQKRANGKRAVDAQRLQKHFRPVFPNPMSAAVFSFRILLFLFPLIFV